MNLNLLFQIAKEKGINEIQVHEVQSNELEMEFLKGKLEKFSVADTVTLSVKGIYNGKMGYYITEVSSETEFETIIEGIIESASVVTNDEEVFIYAGDEHYEKVEKLYDESLNQVGVNKKIELVRQLETTILELDKRIVMAQAMYADGENSVQIVNSNGLNLSKKVNGAFLGAMVIASDGNDQRTSFEYKLTNDFSDLNINEIAKNAVDKAVSLLGSSPVPSGTYQVLLVNTASISLLAPHISMFSAESVHKNVSLLKGKIGELIASTNISIVDDPFIPRSIRSGSFDDEGVATKKKRLVDHGKLTGYMHNLKTAKIDGLHSTGNGFGGGIRPTNFYIEAGSNAYDDVVKSIKKGLIITQLDGTHAGCSPVSGDFSLQAAGYLVEDGKIVRPVNLITIAGNYLALLQNVKLVCDDLKFNYGFIGSPSLLIDSLQVSGN
jgi:PmbA protein